MSDLAADSPGEVRLSGPKPPGPSRLAEPELPSEGWTSRKFFFVLAFVLASHVALIFLFGTKKEVVPRAATNFPHWLLADGATELIALGDPTLFARPNSHDLVTAFWRRLPPVAQPDYDWSGAPRYLTNLPADLGARLRDFVQNNRPPEFALNFKPEPRLVPPDVALEGALPQATTVQISGELARRPLLATNVLAQNALPSIPYNDVIAPSKIEALVDAAGNVTSPVVLESSGDSDADRQALRLVNTLHFAPAPQPTLGDITFTWHTVPLTSTNANAHQ